MEKHKPDATSRLASITASALDTAILELTSGSTEQCLDTLNTLKELLMQWAGNQAEPQHTRHQQYLTIENTTHSRSPKLSIT